MENKQLQRQHSRAQPLRKCYNMETQPNTQCHMERETGSPYKADCPGGMSPFAFHLFIEAEPQMIQVCHPFSMTVFPF